MRKNGLPQNIGLVLAIGRGEQEEVQFFSFGPYVPDFTRISTPRAFKNEILLRQKFLTEGLTATQIAREFSSSKTTIKAYLRRYNIKRKIPCGKHQQNLALGERMVKGRVRPHKGELKILESILAMHQKEGLSPTSIARVLNVMKIPTKRQGKKWDHSVIIHILRRKGVYGPIR